LEEYNNAVTPAPVAALAAAMTAKVAFDMVFILGPGESWVVFEVRREGSLGGYTTCCTFSSLARANHEKKKRAASHQSQVRLARDGPITAKSRSVSPP
jgi:hypothetical protein